MRKFKNIYLALFIATLTGSYINAMDKKEVPILSAEKLKHIEEVCKKAIEKTKNIDVSKILDNAAKNKEKYEAAKQKAFDDGSNNQNTLLGSKRFYLPFDDLKIIKLYEEAPSLNLGIYKRDFIELIEFATEIAADKMFFDKAQESRQEHIFRSIKDNHKELKELLDKVDKEKEEFVQKYNEKNKSQEP